VRPDGSCRSDRSARHGGSPAATAPARTMRRTPTAIPAKHGRTARPARRQPATQRPGGSGLWGASPRPPPCAGSSLLPPDRGSWPGPRRARRSPAPSCRVSGHGRPGPDAATGTGMTRQSPVTPQRHGQSGPTRPDRGHGGEIRADTVWALADPLGLPSTSRLPTRKSAKPGQDQSVRTFRGTRGPSRLPSRRLGTVWE
jgi:hypothetical protein